MSYKLHSLTLRNFVVFVDEFTIQFSDSSINHIEAEFKQDPGQSNGAGKSTILDAISLALFGKGVRFNHLVDYVAPTNPTGGVYLSLELKEDITNNILRIERWRRPGSNSNKARVWSNGKLLTKDSTVTAVDGLLSEYIGVSHSNFMSCIFSVMLPGFLTLRPAQRFEILENALAVKKLDLILKRINDQAKLTSARIDETNTILTEKRQMLGQESAKRDIFSQNKEKLESAIETQREELQSLYIQDAKLTSKREQLLSLREEAQSKHVETSDKYSSVNSDGSKLQNQIDSLKSDIKLLSDNLTSTGSEVKCKICHSSLDSDSKDTILMHYTNDLEVLTGKLDTVNLELSKLKDKLGVISKTIAKISSNVSMIDSELSINRASAIACEKTIRITQESLQVAESAFDPTTLNILIDEVDELTDQRNNLQKDLKMTIAWKQAMSKNGLRLAYLKEEIGLLSEITSKFATSVYAMPMSIKFFITEDRDTPTIDFTVNDKNANAFSTGERKLLDIAITLSLMTLLKTNGMTLQTLILDEALDGLSASSKENVVRVVKQLAEDNQIVSISHDPMFKSLPGNIIKIIKDVTTETSVIEMHQR